MSLVRVLAQSMEHLAAMLKAFAGKDRSGEA